MPKNKKEVIRGFRNIHFAPYENDVFKVPAPIRYAKSGEYKLNYEHDPTYADDTVVDDGFLYTGGDGKISVLDLTPDEQALILGSKRVKGGVVVNSNDTAPRGAFLFEKQFKNSTHKRLFVVYSCVCSNPGIVAQTLEDKAEDSVAEIPLSVSELPDGNIYYYIDTNDPTVTQEQIENWYKTVQFPIDITASEPQTV